MRTVRYTPTAARDLSQIEESVREDVKADVDAYAEDPAGFDVVRLSGVDALRLRVGEHRVILRETATRITVLTVQHRASVYKRIGRKKRGAAS